VKENEDAFGRMLLAHYHQEHAVEIIERDDGFIDATVGPAAYFAPYEEWPLHQRQAIEYARGRVLDVGCGAGRVSLYLQEKGLRVLGIDNSPLALEVCRLRGVRELSLTPLMKVSPALGTFDTIVMFGNNFGLFESPEGARRMLRRFHEMTSPDARLIVESNDPYPGVAPEHLAYHEMNRRRGRMPGQLSIRVRFRAVASAWFEYLIVSKEEMQSILEGTGWKVHCFFDEPDNNMYAAVIFKTENG
jgi:SAM-dependent methyltransferase